MTEELQGASTVPSGSETVVSGTGDTVVSGGSAESVASNDFSWNTYVEGVKAKDEKLAKTLERYSSVDDIAKALFETKQLVSKGIKEPELPANATEEQIKEYREKVGIPSAPSDYKFPDGVKVKEEDKPLWDLFGKFAIDNHISQKDFAKLAPTYYAMEAAIREQGEKDFKEIVRTQDAAIKEMWGTDAETNMKANEAFLLNAGGEKLAKAILSATSADGEPLGNHPTVAKWLNEQARQAGYADLMPYSNKQAVDDLNTKIQNLEKLMGDHTSAYWKGEHAQAKQKEYLELTSLREKLVKK